MKGLRSLLYAPANQVKLVEKVASYGADAIIFDLEDLVPVAQKPEARLIAREYIEKFKKDTTIIVRVNPPQTGMMQDDLEAVVVDGLTAITVPKSRSPEPVREADALLTKIEKAHGLPVGKIEIDVSFESAQGVYFSYEILMASSRIGLVTIGIAQDADLQTDLGCLYSEEGIETLYVRSKVLLAARTAGIENPVDGVYASLHDEEGLIKASQLARRLGYRGKKVIHPSHVETVNRIFTPTAKEIDYYHRVLEAFDKAVAQGSAATSVDGKLIDYAMIGYARKVLSWAESIKAKG